MHKALTCVPKIQLVPKIRGHAGQSLVGLMLICPQRTELYRERASDLRWAHLGTRSRVVDLERVCPKIMGTLGAHVGTQVRAWAHFGHNVSSVDPCACVPDTPRRESRGSGTQRNIVQIRRHTALSYVRSLP